MLALALSAVPASAQADAVVDLRNGLRAMVAAGELPNARVLIARRGRVVADVTLGERHIATHAPLADDAVFRLYSMSKPITSVAALMLVEDGRLSLDDPVAQYLPAFAATRVYTRGDGEAMTTVAPARAMTVRDLLTHASGLTYQFVGDGPVQRWYRRHGAMRDTAIGRQPDDAAPAHDIDTLVARLAEAPLLHQPGARFSYGYSTTVLGKIVEQVAGEPLETFLKRRIFDPLEMHDTGFVVTDAQLPRFVTLYRSGAGGLTPVETAAVSEYRDPARLRDGGGALAGTARDYLHFAQMLADGGTWRGRRLLRAETVAAMFRPTLPTGGTGLEDTWFGLGLALGEARSEAAGGLPAGAGSWSGSANSYFVVDRAQGVAAVLMTNVLLPRDRTEKLRRLVNRAIVALRR